GLGGGFEVGISQAGGGNFSGGRVIPAGTADPTYVQARSTRPNPIFFPDQLEPTIPFSCAVVDRRFMKHLCKLVPGPRSDPIGFPRIELFNLRAIQIWQNKNQVQIVYQNSQVWRNIWTDGRELPKEILEPRWYGYSVGK